MELERRLEEEQRKTEEERKEKEKNKDIDNPFLKPIQMPRCGLGGFPLMSTTPMKIKVILFVASCNK
jgi:hypothetical protein